MTIPGEADVLIAGGGPCGLMLANELGRRGISAVLVDEKPSTAFNPQANATQARTMEHYRRLGLARDVRAQGLPGEYPTDIAYFTRYAAYELARFSLPSAKQATDVIKRMSGSWSAAELPHRVSQKFVETVLRQHAEALPGISVNYGWRLASFTQDADGVTGIIEKADGSERKMVRAAYLVGADGPRSKTREALGFSLGGETGVQRDFMGGRMCAVYLRAPDFYKVVPHAPAWMYVTFNDDRRTIMAAVDGKGEFAFHTQLRASEDEDAITDDMAKAMFLRAAGACCTAVRTSAVALRANCTLRCTPQLRASRLAVPSSTASRTYAMSRRVRAPVRPRARMAAPTAARHAQPPALQAERSALPARPRARRHVAGLAAQPHTRRALTLPRGCAQAAAPAMVAVAPLPADGKLYDEADLAALNNDTKARSREGSRPRSARLLRNRSNPDCRSGGRVALRRAARPYHQALARHAEVCQNGGVLPAARRPRRRVTRAAVC
jgi:2-polyprenyl-6-methoxyphenol hydroxylase-like FAD-dependent oxidoreductase